MGRKLKKQNKAINVGWCGQKLYVVSMEVRKANLYPLLREELNYNINLTFRGSRMVQER